MTFYRFNSKELEEFCQFLAREYGLSFPAARYSFIENRIEPVMRDFGLRTLADIILTAPKDLRLRMDLLNSLTTNETWFFRHPEHFTILRKHIIPAILEQKRKTGDNRIAIWSAGCSIGAELYSILFTLLECIPEPDKYNIQLTGSDISSDAIKSARIGRYTEHELRLLNETMLKKYLQPYETDRQWQVIPELARYADFEVLNLLESWPARRFDIIFCRNTMIYFDSENKQRIARRFFDSLLPNGYYFTSANEVLHTGSQTIFKKLFLENEIVYQKSTPQSEYLLVRFATPSDLLRALNLLKNNSYEYHLEKVEPSHKLAPTRAIYFNCQESSRVEELFELSSIKISSSEVVIR
jgi:chemotaxis protein methyltransferase CheR